MNALVFEMASVGYSTDTNEKGGNSLVETGLGDGFLLLSLNTCQAFSGVYGGKSKALYSTSLHE